MSSLSSNSPPDQWAEMFPVLASLGLSPTERKDLTQQGFVSEEQRGRRKYHKLRFRSEGRQVVRYIGNAQRAARVRAELEMLQQPSKAQRELKARVQQAGKLLRESKQALEPVLEAYGFRFHGYAIRRPRTSRTTASPQSEL